MPSAPDRPLFAGRLPDVGRTATFQLPPVVIGMRDSNGLATSVGNTSSGTPVQLRATLVSAPPACASQIELLQDGGAEGNGLFNVSSFGLAKIETTLAAVGSGGALCVGDYMIEVSTATPSEEEGAWGSPLRRRLAERGVVRLVPATALLASRATSRDLP